MPSAAYNELFGLPPGVEADDMRSAPLARTDDPLTSKVAASRVKRFRVNHEDMIVGALGVPGTAHDVARRTGLDAVQVDRRVAVLIKAGRIRVLEQTRPSPAGVPCRVYDQVTTL